MAIRPLSHRSKTPQPKAVVEKTPKVVVKKPATKKKGAS